MSAIEEEVRSYTFESGEGRLDKDGVVWWACDPYPTWYRWEDKADGTRELITRSRILWADQ